MTPMQGIEIQLSESECVFSLCPDSTKNGRVISGFFPFVVSMRLGIKLLAPNSCDAALMASLSQLFSPFLISPFIKK